MIGRLLKDLNIPTRFVDGLRVTDEKTLEIVEMVLAGMVNKEIVKNINDMGGNAIGLSGKDGRLLTARPPCDILPSSASGRTFDDRHALWGSS